MKRRKKPLHALEPLEPRRFLDASASLAGGVWRIHGADTPGAPADVIVVRAATDQAHAGLLEVVDNGEVIDRRNPGDVRAIKVFGGKGDDTITIENLPAGKKNKPITAEIRGGAGNDTLTGGDENDVIRGEAGNDVLRGGAGNDKIYGGAGDDHLIDEAGDDRLDGGSGNDLFVYGQNNGGSNTLLGRTGNDQFQGADPTDFRDHENIIYPGRGADELTVSLWDQVRRRSVKDTVSQAQPPVNPGNGNGGGDGGTGTGVDPIFSPPIFNPFGPPSPHPIDATPITILRSTGIDDAGYSPDRASTPTLRIIRSQADLQAAIGNNPGLASIDFDTQMIVLASLGSAPTTGYWVEITGVYQSGDTLWVQGLARHPGSTEIVGDIVLAPYTAVVIDKIDNVTLAPEFLSISGAFQHADVPHPVDATSMPIAGATRGTVSPGFIPNQSFSVIQSRDALTAAIGADADRLSVDFDTQMVVLAASTSHGFGTYDAEMTGVYRSGNTLWIQGVQYNPNSNEVFDINHAYPVTYQAIVIDKVDNAQLLSEFAPLASVFTGPTVDPSGPANLPPDDAAPVPIADSLTGSGVYQYGRPQKPALGVVRSYAALSAAIGSDADKLSVNFDTQMVILVYRGDSSSSAYPIEITGVRRSGNNLWVEGIYDAPHPDQAYLAVMTSPYAAVVVDKIDGITLLADFNNGVIDPIIITPSWPPILTPVAIAGSVSGAFSNLPPGFGAIRSSDALKQALGDQADGLAVDFSSQMVMYYSSAVLTYGGVEPQITAVYRSNDAILVQVDWPSPVAGPITDTITQPFCAVVVDKIDDGIPIEQLFTAEPGTFFQLLTANHTGSYRLTQVD